MAARAARAVAATARPPGERARLGGETDGDGGGAWLEVDRLPRGATRWRARRPSGGSGWRGCGGCLRWWRTTMPPPSPRAAAAAEEEAAEWARRWRRRRRRRRSARWRREAEAFTRDARAAQAATERQREAEEAGWRDFYKEVQSELASAAAR